MVSLDDVKSVINSIITSSPNSMTIAQILDDYRSFEGHNLPLKDLQYSTVYDLLRDMSDILTIPYNPNMNSYVQIVANDKTSHLRELILRQKPRKQKTRGRRLPRNSHNYKPNNVSYYHDYSNNRKDHEARGYNYVKHSFSSSPKPTGFVTKNLQRCVEDLCRKSKNTSIKSLKYCLLNHKDYEKLNVFNIEEAINMLKFFIYLDKGGVHLKDSPHEIFRSNDAIPKIDLQSVINEDEEYAADDTASDYEELYDDGDGMELNSNSNYGLSSLHSKFSDSFVVENANENHSNKSSGSTNGSLYNSFEHKIELQKNVDKSFKSSDPFMVQKKNTDNLSRSNVSATESLYSNFKNRPQITMDKPLNLRESVDYKKIIIAIIAGSSIPITVNQVLKIFKMENGFDFPFKKLSCRTCLDYFRLSPSIFKLDDPYSKNSIVKLGEDHADIDQKNSIRTHLICASISKNGREYKEDNKEKVVLCHETLNAELEDNNHQSFDKSLNALYGRPKNPYEKYDSDMILTSMKEKMRSLLSRHKNGIMCDEFMDIYAKEYGSGFVYNEYGFKSMKDMAYQLPSVFYVKDNIEYSQCILFNAERRNELETNSNDPSEFYKNIPKTVLCNLSHFFKKYSFGVDLDQMNTLYCSEYGRSYEPIKYGYDSENHMFQSLNKMVSILDNKLYTVDPYAYTSDFIKNDESEDQDGKMKPVAQNKDLLLTYINSSVCHGKFEYPEFIIRKKKNVNIYVAEIYNPGYFYIQMASDVDNLQCFMNELQIFYENNEHKYSILPEFITVGLPCASRFEESNLWHRAQVTKINDDSKVTIFYIDYGSIEVVPKCKVKLLDLRFGALPIQSLPCTLFKDNQHYCRRISNTFAALVDNNRMLDVTIKTTVSINEMPRYVVDLFLCEDYNKLHVNKIIVNELKKLKSENQNSVRKTIVKAMIRDKNVKHKNKQFVAEVIDKNNDEDSYYEESEEEVTN